MKSFNFPYKIAFLLSLLNKVDQVNSRGFNYSQALMLFMTSSERNATRPLPTSCSKVLYTNYLSFSALPYTNNPRSAILGYLFAVSQACQRTLFCPLPFPDNFLPLDTFSPITLSVKISLLLQDSGKRDFSIKLFLNSFAFSV